MPIDLITQPPMAKMANDHPCVPLYNNVKRCDSGKYLSHCNFPMDAQKRKRTPSLECIIYFEDIVNVSLVPNPKWRLRDNGL